jgi:hypothetical protein
MRRDKFFLTALFMTVFSIPLFSNNSAQPAESEKQVAKKTPTMNSPYADTSMTSESDCSSLSSEEQDFASKLNDTNAMMFCSKMTPMQRQKAMQMSGMRGSSGTKMNPDDAVQNMMQNNGGQMNKGSQRGSGACPVQ